MKLQDLAIFDPSIKIINNSGWPEEILAISAFDSLKLQSIVFIKNAKFLKKFEPKMNEASKLKIGAIIDEKFFNLMSKDVRSGLEGLAWLGVAPDVGVTLTLLSRPFYELKMNGINTQVDGRQMGTTDIHPSAYIAQNVFIGEHVKIGPNVEIMPGSVILPHTEIGEGSKIYPNVTIYPFTKIGKSCRIHSGVVIGSDGFGYTFHQGQHQKIWHMGGVDIHDDVEIGSNSSIDMGTFSPTEIRSGTRIDNLVQIAHNVKIGRGCIICGQSGIAGSAVLEDFVVLAGRAAIGPDSFVGRGAQIAGGAKVSDGTNIPPGSVMGGHPARDIKEWLKGVAYIRTMSLKEKSKE